jgi:undecaprenyl-diphosphatase
MELWKAIVLGATQGLTEFLPISSSGHLALAERWLNLTELSLSFEIIVHLGTLAALVFYFRRQLLHLSGKYWKMIVIATLPAVGFGLLLKPYLESTETSGGVLALQFLFSAFFMFVADQLLRQEDRTDRLGKFWEKVSRGLLFAADRAKLRYSLSSPNSWQAFFIGLFQALAILPAVSRSGATLFAGLLVGLPRTQAFEFAFIISIPAIAGAIALDLLDMWQSPAFNNVDWGFYLLATAASAVFGFLALWILEYTTKHSRLAYFAWYLVLVSILSVLFV